MRFWVLARVYSDFVSSLIMEAHLAKPVGLQLRHCLIDSNDYDVHYWVRIILGAVAHINWSQLIRN